MQKRFIHDGVTEEIIKMVSIVDGKWLAKSMKTIK